MTRRRREVAEARRFSFCAGVRVLAGGNQIEISAQAEHNRPRPAGIVLWITAISRADPVPYEKAEWIATVRAYCEQRG